MTRCMQKGCDGQKESPRGHPAHAIIFIVALLVAPTMGREASTAADPDSSDHKAVADEVEAQVPMKPCTCFGLPPADQTAALCEISHSLCPFCQQDLLVLRAIVTATGQKSRSQWRRCITMTLRHLCDLPEAEKQPRRPSDCWHHYSTGAPLIVVAAERQCRRCAVLRNRGVGRRGSRDEIRKTGMLDPQTLR